MFISEVIRDRVEVTLPPWIRSRITIYQKGFRLTFGI